MGGKQLGVSDYEKSNAQKCTKREKFLAEMEKEFSWQALVDLIAPYYPKTRGKGGRPSYRLATMLPIHLQQQWYSFSGTAAVIQLRRMR